MCRNIRVLSHFEPPTTESEVRDAALQYVRKVSGLQRPRTVDTEAFERAVAEVAKTTWRLIGELHPTGPARTREAEAAKGKARWAARQARSLAKNA